MSEKLSKLEVNLQQSIIWTGEENVCNTICAITHKHRDLVVIGVFYRHIEDQILAICGIENPKVFYDDSFRIDTWENRIEKYLVDAYQDEERRRDKAPLAKDILTAALEGGSNYWFKKIEFGNSTDRSLHYLPGLELWAKGEASLMITEDDGTTHELKVDKFIQEMEEYLDAEGFESLSELASSHDAGDADHILQCALFDELVYG